MSLPPSLVHSWARRIFCPTRSTKTNLASPTRGKASTRACGRSRTTPESSSQAIRSVGSILYLWFREKTEAENIRRVGGELSELSVTVELAISTFSFAKKNGGHLFSYTGHPATEFIRNRGGGKHCWWQQRGRLCWGGRWQGKAEGRQDRIQTEKDSHLQGTLLQLVNILTQQRGQFRYNRSTEDDVTMTTSLKMIWSV